MFIPFIDKVVTKAGNLRGPEREDVIKWIGEAWREIDTQIIINAYKKTRLYDSQLRTEERVHTKEVSEVIQGLDEFDIDDPYLDDAELEIFYGSDLEFED